MVQILPMEDRDRERKLLEGLETAGGELRVLLMEDRGEEVGYTAVELKDKVLRILKLHADGYDFTEKPDLETAFVLDTLMRSAASYGETFGAESIETAFPDFFDFLRLRGFKPVEDHLFTPMSTIVHYE